MPWRAIVLDWRHGALWLSIAQGVVPLLVVLWLRLTGQKRDGGWLWVALAFAVSTLADLGALLLPKDGRWPVSIVYPVSQAGLVLAALLPRREALIAIAVLVVSGAIACLWRGVEGPDVALRSVAFLAVAGVVFNRWDLPVFLQPALLTYFALGWCSWLLHAHYLVLPTWGLYQSVRLAGLTLFCVAAYRSSPRLRLVPAS